MDLIQFDFFYFQGYLYSSTVDYLSTSQPALSYTWLLMAVGWLLPNIIILMAHGSLIVNYRYKASIYFK